MVVRPMRRISSLSIDRDLYIDSTTAMVLRPAGGDEGDVEVWGLRISVVGGIVCDVFAWCRFPEVGLKGRARAGTLPADRGSRWNPDPAVCPWVDARQFRVSAVRIPRQR
jgi:hypothetical protein